MSKRVISFLTAQVHIQPFTQSVINVLSKSNYVKNNNLGKKNNWQDRLLTIIVILQHNIAIIAVCVYVCLCRWSSRS